MNNGRGELEGLGPVCLSSNRCQIRPIVDFGQAGALGHRSARPGVAFFGISSSVATRPPDLVQRDRRRPPDASRPPARPPLPHERPATWNTVSDAPAGPRRSADWSCPDRAASTIRHRRARACDDFARRDNAPASSRSTSVKTNSAFGRRSSSPHQPTKPANLQTQHTSGAGAWGSDLRAVEVEVRAERSGSVPVAVLARDPGPSGRPVLGGGQLQASSDRLPLVPQLHRTQV